MSKLKLFYAILTVLLACFIVGGLLPWLFSAKSTIALMLGIAVIIASGFGFPYLFSKIFK